MLFCLSFHDGSGVVFKMTHFIPWLPGLTHAMLPSYLRRNDLVSPKPYDTF